MSERQDPDDRETNHAQEEAAREAEGALTAVGAPASPATEPAASDPPISGPNEGKARSRGPDSVAAGGPDGGFAGNGGEERGQDRSGGPDGAGAGGKGAGMDERGVTTPALRRQAGVALALLGIVIIAVAAFTTPWHILTGGPPDPARDFTAAQIARGEAFDAATSLPSYLSLALTLIFAGLLVATPFGAKVLGVLKGPWWLRVIVGTVVITAIVEALRWPIGMWFETILREYGLSTQDWAGWTADRLKNLGVETVLLGLMLLVLVALARHVRRWWIPAALGAFAFTVAASFVYPVVFEPLFNEFTPMQQGTLRTNLLDLAARDGVPVEDVLVADASRRTTALNAYVSGFGATRRIVVYDTLLKAPQREVELVVAHELGHAKYDDVLHGTLIGALGSAFGAILLYLVFDPLRRRTKVTSITDPRAVGALLGLMTIGGFLLGPAQNLISRHIEARADVHALDLTRDPATFIAMQKRLATTNISDLTPNAVEYVLYASHPSSPERIAMARAWARLNGVPIP